MKKISYYWTSIVKGISAMFGISMVPCGIEVTDQAIRLAYLDGGAWQFAAIRLEPGIILKGKIKERERFMGALTALREKVIGFERKGKKIDATLVIGEAAVYNQIFSLPMVEGNSLRNAITLNMQMASPMAAEASYSGWQIVGRDAAASRIDVLGTFADRATVDDLSLALFEAGFVSIAVEPKALALARMFRKEATGIDLNAPYILIDIDDTGFVFLIIRGGQLYFEYASAWSDLADEKGLISMEKFKETMRGNLRQVMNFYLQHWSGKMAGIVVSAVSLLDETKEIVGSEFELPVVPFVPTESPEASPEWFAAVGAGLRGADKTGKKVDEINLLGDGARDVFRKDRVLRFAAFWSVFIPVASALLIVLFAVANLFLVSMRTGAAANPAGLAMPQSQEMAALVASSTAFNRSVALIAGIEGSENPTYAIVQDVEQAAVTDAITITRFSFSSAVTPITVVGQAQSESSILAFKNALAADPRFTSIDLPVTNIQNTNGVYAFSMGLTLAQASGTGE